jgi:exopolyphosphatase
MIIRRAIIIFLYSFFMQSHRPALASFAIHRIAPVRRSIRTGPIMTGLSLQDFLQEKKYHMLRTQQIVIGNEAGDADSISSAITLAYVLDRTPIVSISREDLKTQRPETVLLLDLADVPIDTLLDVNNANRMIQPLNVTLVDHNRFALVSQKTWHVVEIVDHHYDEGWHASAKRDIAFCNEKATVASTCTLVAERLSEIKYYPASLKLLLLGTILLDSINMSPEAGKGTVRDQAAIDKLLESTNWQELPEKSRKILQISEGNAPNTRALFDSLQAAKFDPNFWKGLSVRDALRLDYKRFNTNGNGSFGASTVLLSWTDLKAKRDLVESIESYMKEIEPDFFVIGISHTKVSATTRHD